MSAMPIKTTQPQVHGMFDPATWTVTYVVHAGPGIDCAFIDSVLDYDPKSGRTQHTSADKVIDYVKANGLQVQWILETHAHADHLTAAPYLRAQLGGQIGIGGHITQVQKVFKGRPVAFETTVAEQRAKNIHVHDGVSLDDFVALRTRRDATLDMPTLILPAVQINIRAGAMPPREDNGVAYLKIPLNAL